MATKKTTKKKAAPKAKPAAKKAATKKAPKEKAEVKPQGPRHPAARVKAAHGSKEALAKALAPALVRENDSDADAIATRLKTASNSQLLRLQRVVDTMKQKWGSREALITALSTAQKKSKDKDYLAKLATFPLPKLVDLATSAERRARA